MGKACCSGIRTVLQFNSEPLPKKATAPEPTPHSKNHIQQSSLSSVATGINVKSQRCMASVALRQRKEKENEKARLRRLAKGICKGTSWRPPQPAEHLRCSPGLKCYASMLHANQVLYRASRVKARPNVFLDPSLGTCASCSMFLLECEARGRTWSRRCKSPARCGICCIPAGKLLAAPRKESRCSQRSACKKLC